MLPRKNPKILTKKNKAKSLGQKLSERRLILLSFRISTFLKLQTLWLRIFSSWFQAVGRSHKKQKTNEVPEDDISDSSSSRTISNAHEDDGDDEEDAKDNSDEENSHQEHENESSNSTDSISSEDPNKPQVTEGKAQLSPNSQKAHFRQKIKEVARELEEEAAKAKKVEGTNQAKKAGNGTPIKSPRVKTVAQKRRN